MTTTTKFTTGKNGAARAIVARRLVPKPDSNGWEMRHNSAMNGARCDVTMQPHEHGIVHLITALATYIDDHATANGVPVGEDGYAGPYVEDIAKAIIKLLSMETGRLDCGALDGMVRDIARVGGIDGDSL